jgi:hypothetical protein
LLATGLRIKVQPDNIPSLRNIPGYHSTISFPRSGPHAVSP